MPSRGVIEYQINWCHDVAKSQTHALEQDGQAFYAAGHFFSNFDKGAM